LAHQSKGLNEQRATPGIAVHANTDKESPRANIASVLLFLRERASHPPIQHQVNQVFMMRDLLFSQHERE